ncbi:hypothetical protein V6Z11_A03G008800 [Gossypium hirsutum]
MKKSHLFSLVFFYLLLVSVSCDVIHDSCDKAAKGDPNIKFDFCVSSFEGNPKAKTATGVADLVKVAIETAMANATSTGAGSSIQSGGKAFEGKDYGTANAEISSAMDAPDTCEEQFKEKKGYVSPLTKENNNFFQLLAIVLSFMNLVPK